METKKGSLLGAGSRKRKLKGYWAGWGVVVGGGVEAG